MLEIDDIRRIACDLLTGGASGGSVDNWLWDRTQRILRNVEHICRLPELVEGGAAIDRFCLTVATLFADSGFIRYADSEGILTPPVLADINPADLRSLSTQVVSSTLAEGLSAARIDKINNIIVRSESRDSDLIEADILSDARNLDDIGAVGVFNEIRRDVLGGRGVSDILESWKRKVDYRYWQARLKESFRFEEVRKIAVQRFTATEYFMGQLKIENAAQDLEDILLEALDPAPPTAD